MTESFPKYHKEKVLKSVSYNINGIDGTSTLLAHGRKGEDIVNITQRLSSAVNRMGRNAGYNKVQIKRLKGDFPKLHVILIFIRVTTI